MEKNGGKKDRYVEIAARIQQTIKEAEKFDFP